MKRKVGNSKSVYISWCKNIATSSTPSFILPILTRHTRRTDGRRRTTTDDTDINLSVRLEGGVGFGVTTVCPEGARLAEESDLLYVRGGGRGGYISTFRCFVWDFVRGTHITTRRCCRREVANPLVPSATPPPPTPSTIWWRRRRNAVFVRLWLVLSAVRKTSCLDPCPGRGIGGGRGIGVGRGIGGGRGMGQLLQIISIEHC